MGTLISWCALMETRTEYGKRKLTRRGGFCSTNKRACDTPVVPTKASF